LRVVLVLAVFLAGACSGPSGPQPAELPKIERPLSVRVLWSTDVGDAQRFTFFPSHAADAVYAAARDGTVTRLDARTGDVRWRVRLELQLSGGVGADENLVAVASEEGEVVALDAKTGAVRWRARVSSEVLAPPALGNGLVLVRSIDNRVFAFGADDGKRRSWCARRPESRSRATSPTPGFPAAGSPPSPLPTARCAGRRPWRCRRARPSSSAWPT
jgi:outer membrane protein assembly factor BamB